MFSSPAAYVKSIEPNRRRFREKIGAVDPRIAPDMERFGDDVDLALAAENDAYRVFQVRWRALN